MTKEDNFKMELNEGSSWWLKVYDTCPELCQVAGFHISSAELVGFVIALLDGYPQNVE
jgi:hypothetical protein